MPISVLPGTDLATGPMCFGTGELGWTMKNIYLRHGEVLPFPAARDLADPKQFFHDRHVRYVFTDLQGIEGLLKREDLRDDPARGQKLKELLSTANPREIGRVGARNHEGIVYEINPV